MSRVALCIGINDYPGTDMDLAGCVNDANDWATEFASRGFSVRTLLDAAATKQAMVAAIRELLDRAHDGDTAAITFSGHGTYVFDVDGDESDGFDEALCPHDVNTIGEPLTDDEIHELLSARRSGVRLLLIADSCHSGTVSRAPLVKNAPRKRFLPPSRWMDPSRLAGHTAQPRNVGRASAFSGIFGPGSSNSGQPPLDDVLMAGCMEGKFNFSYDATFDGRANGAFTSFALKALRSLPPNATYEQWHAAITPSMLPTADFPQTPQLVAIEAARRRAVLS